jgi:hypothetical protein
VYGIISELCGSLATAMDLLALSCTIASITGSCRASFEPALEAIQERFEVPSVTKRE